MAVSDEDAERIATEWIEGKREDVMVEIAGLKASAVVSVYLKVLMHPSHEGNLLAGLQAAFEFRMALETRGL
jgi:hypothetical protein